ncbi:MAG: hypothetical protein H0T79_17345, partial [Deltaproteobacteria bacterium]|nr:hypothetical protein [Deltaproteobacteria bacterium]
APPAAPIEVVGDPLGDWRASPDEAYARNLWDLQAFRGRLYLGYGDAIQNTGPTEVIAFDPATHTFIHDAVFQEEAILRYRVFGDRLFVPGVDAVTSQDDTLYVRDAAGWTRLPLTDVVHASDVSVRGDEICVAVQDRATGGAVRCTRDQGGTWKAFPTQSWRSVSLFELGASLYVSSHDSGVLRVDGRKLQLELPGVTTDRNVLVTQPIRCGNDVVFIGKRIQYAGEAATVDVLGVFRASVDARGSIGATRVDIGGTPTDVFTHANRCYVLTNREAAAGTFDVTVFESLDNQTWNQRVTFVANAMARSAELMNDYFYIGLGCASGQCTRMAGRLLRTSAQR